MLAQADFFTPAPTTICCVVCVYVCVCTMYVVIVWS